MRAVRLILGVVARYAAALPLDAAADMATSSSTSAGPLPSTTTGTSSAALPSATKFTLPNNDPDPTARKQEIQLKQQGFLYGPSILGQTTFYPIGTLGTALSLRDQQLWAQDAASQTVAAYREAAEALADIQGRGGFKTLDDFKYIYEGHWKETVPQGIDKGILSNYTSDLLFSMERLSINPYVIKRLRPGKDKLPFDVDDKTVKKLTGAPSLGSLHAEGRLFAADHGALKKYTAQAGRYSAACQALFYIDKRSGQFLPLAIKTNVGADLTYTPLDEANDWLLAKIMFNNNDLVHGQMYHILFHSVPEIVYLAAVRTMASGHPVLALMKRLMYQAYAIRPVGERVLTNPGGFWDQNFGLPATAGLDFASGLYASGAGGFRAGYLEADLRARGLLDSDCGPPLARFPYLEDGRAVVGSIRRFVEAFVDSTYGRGGKGDEAVRKDWEVQAWVAEANGPAKVRDFPAAPLGGRSGLVDVLTHMAWMTGGAHHVLNQGSPVKASGVLPLHPAALYAPVPTSKGATGSSANGTAALLPWLPNEAKAVEEISLLARFNRAQVGERKQTLHDMFASDELLAGNGPAYAAANARFVEDTGRLSREIQSRGFDAKGLSQGMPFIWTSLDPAVIPFFLSV